MEEFDTAFEIANQVKAICSELNIHYIFKASYKKANRSKLDSFTGIGDVEALEMIKKIGQDLSIDTITDIHESHEAEEVSTYVTIYKYPHSFVTNKFTDCRWKTGLPVNVKKANSCPMNPCNLPSKKFKVQETKMLGFRKRKQLWVS